MQNRIILSLKLLTFVILGSLVVLGFTIHKAPQKPPVHNYEYIMTAQDGNSDSTLLYTIYDDEHHLVGVVESNKMDSLIINDNL